MESLSHGRSPSPEHLGGQYEEGFHICAGNDGSSQDSLVFQTSLVRFHCDGCNGQLGSSLLYQQAGRLQMSSFGQDLPQTFLVWQRSTTFSCRQGTYRDQDRTGARHEQVLTTEWSLHLQVAKEIWSHFHCPQIDLFATESNDKLPIHVSPCPDSEAWGVDAMSMSWDGTDSYAYPPTALVPQVLRKFLSPTCNMILVAPYWPSMSWFPILLYLSGVPPLKLPNRKNILKQPHNGIFHHNPDLLNLHAWSLSHRH